MEREIRVRFTGDARDMQRASQDAKKALDEVAKETEQTMKRVDRYVDSQGRWREANGRFVSQAELAKAGLKNLGAEAGNAASAFQRAGSEARQAGSSIDKMGAASHQASESGIKAMAARVGELAAGFVTASAAAATFTKGLNYNAQMEQSEVAFKTLTGSAEQAKSIMADLSKFAATTPFELPQVVAGAKQLETYGLSYQSFLKDAGDLASAFNVEITEVTSALGRIKAGDFGEAFERMRDFGISRKELEGQGLVFDKSGSYQGSVEAAMTAVQKIIRQKFGGMMEEQSKTFTGQFSNLTENINSALGMMTGGSFDSLKETFKQMNGLFGEEAQQKARAWGSVIKDGMEVAIDAAGLLGGILGRIGDNFLHTLQHARMLMSENDIYKERGAKVTAAIGGLSIFGPDSRINDPRLDKVRDFAKTGTIQSSRNFAGSLGLGLESMGTIESTMIDRLKAMAPDLTSPQIMQQARQMGFGKGQLDKLRKALSEAEGFTAQAISERADEIAGMVRDAKSQLSKSKNIAQQKPPATGGGSNAAPGKTGKAAKPDLLTMPDPGKGSWGSMFDANPAATSAKDKQDFESWAKAKGYNLDPSFIGSEQDPLVKGMRAYAEWKANEGERLNYLISDVMGTLGDLAIQHRSGGGLGAGSALKGLSGLTSYLGPQGAPLAFGLNFVGGYIDQRDRALDVYTRQARGEQISREDYLEASKAKHSDAFIRFMRPDFYDTKAVEEDMRAFDALTAAKKAETIAAEKAAQALAKVSDAGQRFSGGMSAFGLKEQMGLGKTTSQDIGKLLSFTAFNRGGDSWDQIYANNASFLSDTERQKKLFDLYGQMSMFGAGTGMDTWMPQLKELGFTGQEFQGMDTKGVMALFQSTIIPAIQELTRINGPAATGSIAGAGTDNSLLFDAPQTRMITNNFTISLETFAVTGDKASFRAFVKEVMTEAATIGGLSV